MTSYQAIGKKNKQLIHLRAEGVFDVTAGLVKSARPDGLQRGQPPPRPPGTPSCHAGWPLCHAGAVCLWGFLYTVLGISQLAAAPTPPWGFCSLCQEVFHSPLICRAEDFDPCVPSLFLARHLQFSTLLFLPKEMTFKGKQCHCFI